jgi:hypothetical protein
MKSENIIVHTVWIGNELSLLEQLTIKLLQKYGHIVHLWSYTEVKNVPKNVVVRDASKILPKSSIFKYTGRGVHSIPNNGIGSLSHWSDQFQMKLLNEEGGIYSQLDVAYLGPLDFESEYIFAVKGSGIAPYTMKCPAKSEYTRECYEQLSKTINENTIKNMQWGCSMRLMFDVLCRFPHLKNPQNILSAKNYLDLGTKKDGPFFNDYSPPENILLIHWSNATVNDRKNDPIKGSYYEKLLKFVGLV